MRFLDTNIVLRYLTRDDEEEAVACYGRFQRVKEGTEELATSEAVITEVVYVLSSPALYHLSRADIRARLVPILSLRGLKLVRRRLYLRGLELYEAHSWLDFEDALAVAHMEAEGIQEIVSHDADFDRIPGIRRVEPQRRRTDSSDTPPGRPPCAGSAGAG